MNAIYKYKEYVFLSSLILFIFRYNGNDIFLIPLFIYIFFHYKSKNLTTNKNHYNKILFVGIFIIILTFFIRVLSFSYHHYDIGIYHNMITNLVTNGMYYDDLNKVHGFGGHFEPLFLAIFYPLYSLKISVFWIIFLKAISIILFVFECRKLNPNIIYPLLLILFFFHPFYHNAIEWEFHPTNLSLVFIIYAYIFIRNENFIKVIITTLIAMGLKENAGVIACGFGLVMMTQKNSIKYGIFLVFLSIFYMGFTWFYIIPHFADGNTFKASDINLIRDFPDKIKYFILAYLPFFFMPLINWKWFLLTIPAIGINLIGKPNMYSGNFHYNDILIPLILVASYHSIEIKYTIMKRLFYKYKSVILIPVISIIFTLPESPVQKLVRYLPDSKDLNAFFEIRTFLSNNPKAHLGVSENISPLVDRGNITIFADDFRCELNNESEYIIIYEQTYRNQEHLKSCLKRIEESPLWIRKKEHQNIFIFQKTGLVQLRRLDK